MCVCVHIQVFKSIYCIKPCVYIYIHIHTKPYVYIFILLQMNPIIDTVTWCFISPCWSIQASSPEPAEQQTLGRGPPYCNRRRPKFEATKCQWHRTSVMLLCPRKSRATSQNGRGGLQILEYFSMSGGNWTNYPDDSWWLPAHTDTHLPEVSFVLGFRL